MVFKNENEHKTLTLILLFAIIGLIFLFFYLNMEGEIKTREITIKSINETCKNKASICQELTQCPVQASQVNITSNRVLCECEGVIYSY